MGLFTNKSIDFDKIRSVVILEQTQLYKEKSNWGLSIGSTLGDSRAIAMDGGNVPTCMEIKFSITYKNGKKEIVKATSGTELCDHLLQLAIDPAIESAARYSNNTEEFYEYEPVSLGKNQLPNGDYLVGRDIPVGTYDFTWVFGRGDIMKFKNDHDTTLGATTYFQHVGTKYDYEYRQCLNVNCKDGELLKINGNVIVGIAKSKKVESNL